jgi:hypothetical protein
MCSTHLLEADVNAIGTVTSQHQAVSPPMSSTHAADQTAANAAHAGQSKATAQLSADRGKADTGAVKIDQSILATATAAAHTADAGVKSDSGLNIIA